MNRVSNSLYTMKSVSLLVLTVVALVSCDQDLPEAKVVKINQGAVKGYKDADKQYYAFYGIPYATAPTGPHKFKAPLPPISWTDTFEAIHRDILCPQGPMMLGIFGQKANMKEDCLVANVFVPDTSADNLPVVVYVHGGAFQMGYSNMFSHEPMLKSGKIIEVNFNYRLGAHGFLCLGTEDAPGNAGMKDQVAALRWVNQNIAKFGGNPDDVTLAGFSAGSASVDLLMLSKSTKGLFNKVIPESGVGSAVWGIQVDPLTSAKEFAKTLNFANVDDIHALEEFYKTAPLDSLLADQFMAREDNTFVFVPCIERPDNEGSFLTETPIEILKQGNFNKVPTLIGFANMEGLFRIPLFEHWKARMNENFSKFLPADLEFANDNERQKVAKEIKQFYFGDKEIDTTTVQGYVDYFSDIGFVYSTMRSVNLQMQSGSDSVYLYEYTYVDDNHRHLIPYGINGADHCAQSLMLVDVSFLKAMFGPSITISENYFKIQEMMSDIWINFITTGKPVTKVSEKFPSGWPTVSSENKYYMELNIKPELRKDLLEKRMDFWDGIYARYYRSPVAPSAPPRKTEL